MRKKNQNIYFSYSPSELEYLKNRDKTLGKVIEKLGYIRREIDTDLFSAVVHHIVGQQISSKALLTVWNRIHTGLGEITPKNILSTPKDTLKGFGISSLKLERIINFSHLVESKELDLDKLYLMKDEEAIKTLTSIPGVGLWTAEMILLFCMQRKDIFSRQDLGINKGLSILYHHEKISKALFEKYRKRFSPFGSIASLYLWEVAKTEKHYLSD